MDHHLLKKFREQLTAWIKPRLASQRLPFQRLEACPEVLTEQGRLIPDLVLWINRDSLFAGSVILLPDSLDKETCRTGATIARALGLGHFASWSAREVSIWTASTNEPINLGNFTLPIAAEVTPADFHQALDWLMAQLKLVTVTTAPAPRELDRYYYANLCLQTLEDLAPGLAEGARLAGGQSAADDWVEQAPLSKAWMSLWRLLLLLQYQRLPPSLQPERLETAMRYALADLTVGPLTWLKHQNGEAPLPQTSAIRLHHLASRLKQLGWPHDLDESIDLFNILLNEAAIRLGLAGESPPWEISHAQLRVCYPPSPTEDFAPFSLVAPRPVLAGWVCRTNHGGQDVPLFHAESIPGLPAGQTYASAIAVLLDTRPLLRQEREQRTLALRQSWPSRRFNLPRKTPAWVWDALHLAGMTTEDLSLILPAGWHLAPGITLLWEVLAERYQIAEAAQQSDSSQALRIVCRNKPVDGILMHRASDRFTIPSSSLTGQPAGLLHAWLAAQPSVAELLRRGNLAGGGVSTARFTEIAWGLFLYLHTSLGEYLWQLCTGGAPLPSNRQDSIRTVIDCGIPLPNETILADLALLCDPANGSLPPREDLDRGFSLLFGQLPQLAVQPNPESPDRAPTTHRQRVPSDDITTRVFVDGIPRFPEHYLMDHYRPVLKTFQIPGPLQVAAIFFDTVRLRTDDAEQTIDVTGTAFAEALILASHTGATTLDLPADEALVEKLVGSYRADLARLWDVLVSECRRSEPRRQSAINLAKKIWQKQGLPANDIFNSDVLRM